MGRHRRNRCRIRARPLKRFIQRYVETAVAKEVIKGELVEGQRLHLRMEDEALVVDIL